MKQLLIVRHGKSSWDYEGVSDIDRPLKEKGINDAYIMAENIRKTGFIPDVFICSPAHRALYTGIIFSRILSVPFTKLWIKESLYLPSSGEIIEILKTVDDGINNVAIIGHNPSLTDLASHLQDDERIDNIPTCGAVLLSFHITSWKQIGSQKADLEFFIYPKMFK